MLEWDIKEFMKGSRFYMMDCNMAPVAFSIKQDCSSELTLWCEGNSRVKSKKDCVQLPLVACRRKSERGREESRAERIEVFLFAVLVVWIWIKGWELRRPLKTFSPPEDFSPPLGRDQSPVFSPHSLGIFDSVWKLKEHRAEMPWDTEV